MIANTATAAIDVHAHYGAYQREGGSEELDCMMTKNPRQVVETAKNAETQCTIVSPLSALMPRGKADAAAGNDETVRELAALPEMLFWVVVHPEQPETYRQARQLLKEKNCVGIKIHPEEHLYPIGKYGERLFSLAAECGAVLLSHSGHERSRPMEFLPFADTFPEVNIILAHLGNGGSAEGPHDLQVRAIQASQNGNIYTDTSSARSMQAGLLEWAVGEIGCQRILYGTDSPLYFAPSQRIRIDRADIGPEAKEYMLRKNAVRLLGLEEYEMGGCFYLRTAE